jgi:hypothetical protein
MKIMQITPEELASFADRYGQVEGLEKLKARLEEKSLGRSSNIGKFWIRYL